VTGVKRGPRENRGWDAVTKDVGKRAISGSLWQGETSVDVEGGGNLFRRSLLWPLLRRSTPPARVRGMR